MKDQLTPSQAVYSLWKAGKQSFERAEAAQNDLSKAADTLRLAAQRLPDTTAHQVDEKLSSAADKAAKMIAARWTDANDHAERAAVAYQEATRLARKAIYGGAAVLLVLFAVMLTVLGLWLLPRFDEVTKLRAERLDLEATIAQLKSHGARANIQSCLDSTGRQRLCVRVDETAKISLRGYRVIQGY